LTISPQYPLGAHIPSVKGFFRGRILQHAILDEIRFEVHGVHEGMYNNLRRVSNDNGSPIVRTEDTKRREFTS
jgi:hypothetical protein